MKLSIVICVYNTDKEYFNRCLASLTHTTLAHPIGDGISYEIVVVDDGSNVDYTELIEKYGVKYVKTENKGIFKARELGVELASGDYIAFCDSDDTVSFNYHLPMLLEALRTGADIVMNDWAFHSEGARYCCKSDSTISGNIDVSGDEVLEKFLSQAGREHSYFVLWNKIYSSRILKNATRDATIAARAVAGNVRFNYSEDALINFFAFKSAKRCINIHTGYYFYRIHASQSVNVVSKERLISHIDFMTATLSIMKDYVLHEPKEKELLSYLRAWSELMSRTHFSYAKKGGYTDLYPYIKEKYAVDKLRISTMHDGSAYSNNKLLPENFEAIDEALLKIWKGSNKTYIADKPSEYVRSALDFIESSQGVSIRRDESGIKIPRGNIPFKKKILYNPTVYKLGMIVFKKGGKMRAFLKKHI